MRHLLLLHPSGAADSSKLLDVLSDNWEVNIARSPAEADRLIAEQNIRIGLILFAPTPHDISPWDGVWLGHHGGVHWIAVLARSGLQNPLTRHLITNHCHDYHTLDRDPQKLLSTLAQTYGMAELIHGQAPDHGSDDESRNNLIGHSPAMARLHGALQKASGTDVPVLITGESGTGKEQVARAVHLNSPRAHAPFVAINCAALPAELIQAELFGYEKGAFTGASERRVGRIEAADGGTLLLDEVGDLPLAQQANLLRFIQEGTIERLGNHQSLQVDARIIAATHMDLEQEVRENRFRADLYYRLNVLRLRVPPLREREQDVIELAYHFLDYFRDEARRPIKGFSRDTQAVMLLHDWPGNVRELMNRVRQAVVLGERNMITPGEMGLEKRSWRRGIKTLDDARAVAEYEVIHASLARNKQNVSRAARELGVSRVTLYRLMERHQINREISAS